MTVDVVLVPADLEARHLGGRTVVVLDVLRATTTLTAALAAGVAEVHIFGDTEDAVRAAGAWTPRPLLVGERKCLRPPGFDLGNSPGAFARSIHQGRTVFFATTNGTRAILAARGAAQVLVGAVVNAGAIAGALAAAGVDVTLLCAGTAGEPAVEDLLGAGAIVEALGAAALVSVGGEDARSLFRRHRGDLVEAMSQGAGGRNLIAAGLAEDIGFAARVDAFDIVGCFRDDPPRVLRGDETRRGATTC